MNLTDEHVAEMIEVGLRLYQRGLLAGTDGNLSVRLDAERILITGAGACKGRLTPNDLVVIDMTGKRLDGERPPSTEVRMHLFAYTNRPDVHACVHAHPPYATAFAAVGQPLAGDVLPELVTLVGEVPLTAYAAPGTEEVPNSLAPFIAGSSAFLLRSHGVLTIGATLDEACNHIETVEHCAHILYLAANLGGAKGLPNEEYARLRKLRQASREKGNVGK